MNKLSAILLLSIICSAFSWKETFIEQIQIGKFTYSIYTQSKFLHDENLNAEFFAVKSKSSKKNLCSAFKNGSRNDTIFIKGSYTSNKKELIFKEYYYSNYSKFSDSVIKRFRPDKSGALYLSKVEQYKEGKLFIE